MKTKMEQFPAKNPNPVLSVEKDGTVLYSNEAGEPLLLEWGVSVGKKLPPHIENIVHRVISLNSTEKMEVSVGKRVYLVAFHPLPEEECINIYGFDTSEQKELEEKLQESKEQYRILFDHSMDGIILSDPIDGGKILSVNQAACRMLGWGEEELIGKGRDAMFDMKDPALSTLLDERARTGSAKTQLIYRRKDGSKFPGEVSTAFFIDSNGEPRTVAIIRDITKRKQIEEALTKAHDTLEEKVKERTAELEKAYNSLKESEKGLAEAQKMAHIGSWKRNFATNKFSWSDEMYRIFGLEPQEFEVTFDSFLNYVHPYDRDYIDNAIKRAMNRNPFSIDFRIISARGEERIVHAQGEVLFDKRCIPVRMRGTTQDITERKQAEEILRNSREQYQILFNSISEGFAHYKAVYDKHGTLHDLLVLEINPSGARFSGVEREAQIGKTCREVWPDVEDYIYKIYNEVDQTGKSIRFEHLSTITGRWYVSQVDRIKKGQLVVTFTDINERKTAEMNLRLSEERYRSFIENSKGIAFQIDENFNLEFIHGAVKEITGYTEKEFFSVISWKQLVVPEDIDMFLESEEKAAQSCGDFQGEIEYRIRTKDGSMKWMHEFHQKISGKSGKLEKYIGIISDITEKKNVEDALEKIEIARKKEIHHRIKNNLQVISSLLDLQAEQFRDKECIKDSEVLEAFKESQDRVISMALIHEELYKGGGFETLNFAPYIEELADNLFRTYRLGNTDINLKLDLAENAFFDLDMAVPLGMIVNELVSNSLKHAFIGRDKGEIKIILHREGNGEFESEDCKSTSFILTVSDNGIGIPENLEIEDLDSLGMQLVTTLVDQLDGELELKKNDGTEFTIRFAVTGKNNQASPPAPQRFVE